MKKNIIVIILLVIGIITTVHGQFITDFQGRPYVINTKEEIKGTAFLFEKWEKAKIITKDNKVYDNVDVLYDCSINELLFLRNGEPNTFITPIQKCIFQNKVYKLSLDPITIAPYTINGSTKFYQILYQSPQLTLVKAVVKDLNQVYEYNNPNATKEFRTTIQFYTIEGDKWSKINLNEKNLVALLKITGKIALLDNTEFKELDKKNEEVWQYLLNKKNS